MIGLSACETLSDLSGGSCSGEMWSEATFYFGRSRLEETPTSQAEWTKFVEEEITPRFPDGFTVFEARGAWGNPESGKTIYEGSKVLTILHPGTVKSRQKVMDLAEAYRSRFDQQAVLTSQTRTCTTFHTGETGN